MPKIWVSQATLNRGKKEDGPSMKHLQVMLLPLDEMLVHRRVTPQQYVAGTHFIQLGEERQSGVKFLV